MSSPERRGESGEMSVMSTYSRLDRMFDEWLRSLFARRPGGMSWDPHAEDVISVDEYRDGDTQVIHAELPGIDPDKDVELTVVDGMLRIDAERRIEDETVDKGYTRHELRYGRFTRTLPLPESATAEDIKATYRDGVLEIRVPVPAPAERTPTRISISKG
ncbi:MAG: Hsp20/alpha crystallin family protein [Blastococcus sp.]